MLATAATWAVIYFRKSGQEVGESDSLTIHFTCDAMGRLEPCGCFTGQHGGLTRLRTWLGERKDPGPVLKVDVGGAIAGGADYDIIQYRYMARAYATMGFAALNMGGREATLPADTLTSSGVLLARPHDQRLAGVCGDPQGTVGAMAHRGIDGSRVGILGVVSPHSVPEPGEGIAVLGLNEAIDRHLPELARRRTSSFYPPSPTKPKCAASRRTTSSLPLIVGGDVAGPTQDILRENESMILFTTNQARTVGTLVATLSGEERKRLTDPSYDIQLLWDSIPQHEELLAMVREYRSEIRKTPLAIDDPNVKDPNAIPGVAMDATYVGSAACKSCHAGAHEVWEKSGHAHAFETLVKTGSDADPHCISCHTVGFGKPAGYRRPMGSTSLVDVGCESCHGPASEHVARYLDGKPSNFHFRPLGPGDCKSCHYGEFSRPFEWDKFWPGIEHGK